MARKIKCNLSCSSIQNAITELMEYRREFSDKVQQLIDRMISEGEQYAMSAAVQYVSDEQLSVSVYGYRSGDKGFIVADGEAVFLEFGAGVYYNGAVGTSPHPKGQEFGFTIGSYGLGQGANPEGWDWQEADGWHHSRGTQANLFMWNTAKWLRENYPDWARELFDD